MAQSLQNSADFLRSSGYKVSFDDYMAAWKANHERLKAAIENLHEADFYDWYRGILEGLGIRNAEKGLIDALNDAFNGPYESSIKAATSSHEVLSILQRRYRLAVISNSFARNTKKDLEISGLFHYFLGFYISSEIGRRKPHPAIFTAALQGFGLRPYEAVMVGDNYGEDVVGAKQVGLKAILIDHSGLPSLDPGAPRPDSVIVGIDQLIGAIEKIDSGEMEF